LSEYPWLSMFGVPLIAEGAIRYLAMAVLFAAVLVLRKNPRRRTALLTIILLVSLVGSVAFYLWIRSEFASLDKLGYLVGPAWVSAWFLVPERYARWRFVASVLVIVPILLLSTNTTAIVAVLSLAVPGTVVLHMLLTRNRISVRKVRAGAVVGIAMVPFVALAAVWVIPEFTDALPSVTSRKYMLQVLMAALQADPSIALWGQGWGEISITADRFRTASDAILWNGSWDGFDRNVSHSANMFVEAVFGAGLPAALFVVFLLISPLLVADAKHLPPVFFVAIVFASVSSTWPQVAMTVGMTTLALALASGDVAGKPWHRRISRPVIWGLPVVVSRSDAEILWRQPERCIFHIHLDCFIQL
jgi:O-antigen ligase